VLPRSPNAVAVSGIPLFHIYSASTLICHSTMPHKLMHILIAELYFSDVVMIKKKKEPISIPDIHTSINTYIKAVATKCQYNVKINITNQPMLKC